MVANDTPASTYRYSEKPVYTTSNGAPIENPEGWQRPGSMGPLLLQDFHLIDLLAHFDREKPKAKSHHTRIIVNTKRQARESPSESYTPRVPAPMASSRSPMISPTSPA